MPVECPRQAWDKLVENGRIVAYDSTDVGRLEYGRTALVRGCHPARLLDYRRQIRPRFGRSVLGMQGVQEMASDLRTTALG